MFKKFIIFNQDSTQQVEEQVSMLINTSHIVSIKPIRMTNSKRQVIEGYWIRLSNNKKYKAVSIPDSLHEIFKEDLQAPRIDTLETELQIQ